PRSCAASGVASITRATTRAIEPVLISSSSWCGIITSGGRCRAPRTTRSTRQINHTLGGQRTLFDLLRELLALETDFVNEFGIRRELLSQGHRPRFRIRLGVVDRDLDLEMSKVGSADSLPNLGRLGNHAAVPVDPRVIAESNRFDHQRVIRPRAGRIPLPRWV